MAGVRIEVTDDIDENDPDQIEALTGWAEHLAARAAQTSTPSR